MNGWPRALAVRGMRPWVLLFSLLSLLSPHWTTPVSAAARVQITHVDASAYPHVSFELHVADASGVPPESISAANVQVRDGGRAVGQVQKQLMHMRLGGTNILLLIDTGISSVPGVSVDGTRAVSSAFVPGLQPPDKVSIALFAEKVHQLTPFTTDKSALTSAMAHFTSAAGSSHIYDALWTSLQSLNSPGQRYAVIVVTDGGDAHSHHHSYTQVAALAHNRHIPIYSVALGQTPVLTGLNPISARSGGAVFPATTSAQLTSVYRRLALVFRHDYLLSFAAPVLYHRGDHVQLQVTYRPTGGAPVTASDAYLVPNAPWVHMHVGRSTLGTIDDPRRISLPVTFTSEDTVAHRVAITDSGWPGLQVLPAAVTVPAYAHGPLHVALLLGTQAAYPGGLRGAVGLHLRALDPGVHLAGASASLPFAVRASTITVEDMPSNLHDVTDFDQGHSIPFTLYSTVYRASTLRVTVRDVPGASVTPRVIHLPPDTQRSLSPSTISVTMAGVPVGREGTLRLRFTPLTPGVHVRHGAPTLSYYVPTWWEQNRKWVIPLVLLILIVLYVSFQTSREALTRKWDDMHRAAARS